MPATARKIWIKRAGIAAAVLLVAAAFVYALAPRPVPVDFAVVTAGPMRETIDEEGRTRIRDIYVISAPISGKVLRTELRVGDPVTQSRTVVARILPSAPPLLDARTRSELEAAAAAARVAITLAEAEEQQARSELAFATEEVKRARRLARSGTIPARSLQKAETDFSMAEAALTRALSNVELRRRELAAAEARLMRSDAKPEEGSAEACCIAVESPVTGQVLRLVAESEQVVAQGTPLMEIGNPADLEIVVDLLSTDAVRIAPGAQALIEGWGGGTLLPARVRRIEPAGFTKVSALGIEEQRVRTILDLTGPPDTYARLGHDYRVLARITVWETGEALQVPLSALFRQADRWAVFKAVDGRARLTTVSIGHRNEAVAEILSGLAAGDVILLHPSDQVSDGVRIEPRGTGG
jgi:HlyD family secretion protein